MIHRACLIIKLLPILRVPALSSSSQLANCCSLLCCYRETLGILQYIPMSGLLTFFLQQKPLYFLIRGCFVNTSAKRDWNMLLVNQCFAVSTCCVFLLLALLGGMGAFARASLWGDWWPFEVFGVCSHFSFPCCLENPPFPQQFPCGAMQGPARCQAMRWLCPCSRGGLPRVACVEFLIPLSSISPSVPLGC